MVNRCKVEMKRRELYNVVKSLKEGDGGIVRGTKEIKSDLRKIHSGVFYFLFANHTVHALGRTSSLRPSSLTHPLQIIIVGCALGQGLINISLARKIV